MTERPDLTSIYSSYTSAFKVYHDVSNEQKNGLACLQQHIPTALEKLQLGKDKPTFKILSIGAGDGVVDQEILKFVQEGYLNVHAAEVEIQNTAVEPNSVFLGRYKESIERRSDRAKGKATSRESPVKFDLKPMSFEEYASSKHDHKQYDMIHAIHSLYHVDNMESTLKHCYYNELGDKGLIACLIGNDSDLMAAVTRIADKYRPAECQRKPWQNPGAKFMHLAEKNAMKYEHVVAPYRVDVTSIFDESSEDEGHLLDFFSQEHNYRQKADQAELAEVLKKIRNMSTEDDYGRLNANATTDLILIYKTQ